jgi:prevent-host-death family protein
MKCIELRDARQSLGECARQLEGPLVVTRNGKPLVAVVPVRDSDMESLSLATNPDFLAMLEQSRARYRVEGGIRQEALRKRLSLPAARNRSGKERPRSR